MEDKLYLENIEEYVYDLEKIVTYKWLAMTLSVSFNEATRMLSEFVLEHSAKRSSKPPIHVIYLITGVSRDATNEKIIISLADEDELKEIKANLDEVISVIIYSVQKGHHVKDRSSLYTAEFDVLQENIHNYSDFCSVKCTPSSTSQHSEVTVDNRASLSSKQEKDQQQHVRRDNQVDKPAQRDKPVQRDKPTQQDKSAQRDKPAQQNKPAQQDKPAQQNKLAQQDKPAQQDKANKKTSNNKSTSKPKGIAAIFASKQAKNATQNSPAHDKPACKQEEEIKTSSVREGKAIKNDMKKVKTTHPSTKANTGAINTKFDKDVFATEDDDEDDVMVIKKDKGSKRSMASNLVTAQVKEEKKDKKKRRRVCQELSSGESDDETVGTNAVKCEAPSAQAVPAGATKRRKIVRKLVNKMYVDNDGSMVTEKEWQEISTDDDSDEPVVASNKTIATSSVKARSKQSTLGAFFHKK